MSQPFPGNFSRPPFQPPQFAALAVIMGIALLFGSLGTLVYMIAADEVGLIQRFGKYTGQASPGMHVKLPFGIDKVTRVKVTHVFKEEFGFRTVQTGVRSSFMNDEDMVPGQGADQMTPLEMEALMLSGDLNVADMEWIVQYRVKDAVAFAFNVRDVRQTLRDISEVVMREVIGDYHITEVLTVGREEINTRCEEAMQKILDNYHTGIQINSVNLQDVTPPDPVKPSFNEVNEALQEKDRTVNQAWENYNHVVPRAKGEAEKALLAAEGYALDRINRAKGEASKYTQILQAYQESKEVMRTRLYLESMRAVFPSIKSKYVVDEELKGLLPLLDLTEKKTGVTS